jgi:hypothetical protein
MIGNEVCKIGDRDFHAYGGKVFLQKKTQAKAREAIFWLRLSIQKEEVFFTKATYLVLKQVPYSYTHIKSEASIPHPTTRNPPPPHISLTLEFLQEAP